MSVYIYMHVCKLQICVYIYILIFKQASACQPPTREICCIGPGIVDNIYVYFEGLHENHVMLTSFALTRMVGAARSQPKFLRKLGPNFQNTGLEIEPRFPAKPLRRKSVPNLGRSWRESSLRKVAGLCASN